MRHMNMRASPNEGEDGRRIHQRQSPHQRINRARPAAAQPKTRGRVRPAKSMLTEEPNPLHNCGAQSSPQERVPRDCLGSEREQLLLEAVMFPQTDEISTIISDTVKVVFKRRLVDRVLRLWAEMARGEGFPRLDHIEPSKLGVGWANCFVIAVQSPVSLSYFAVCGVNLSFAFCTDDSLAGVLLSHLPMVLSERRCLMIEGSARLRDIGILYRSGLYPLSDDGIAIDHVLGAANYRPLRENEIWERPSFERTKWL